MKPLLAIARLTVAEGLRMRLVIVFLAVLLLLVVRLPYTSEGDGTQTGVLQSFLAYSLGALSLLLSLATIFLSCATLTTEIRERSLHMVVTKPVTRFQILVGKWIGVNLLNLLIVVLGGLAIYGFALSIKNRPTTFERDRLQMRDVVWTARVSARPVAPLAEIEQQVAERVAGMLNSGEIQEFQRLAKYNELSSQALNEWRSVPPGYVTLYRFEHLPPPRTDDSVIEVRYKVRGTPLPRNEQVHVGWVFCDVASGAPLHPPVWTEERSGYTHKFLVSATPVIQNGAAALQVINPTVPEDGYGIFFDGDDSLEIYYRMGNFEANYAKGLGLILLKLALIAAVGLFFSVFVSFPVACLCTSAFYVICIGLPFILEAIGANTTMLTPALDPYGRLGPTVRAFLVPFVKAAFPDFVRYSGIGALVDGVYIHWKDLTWATVRTLGYGAVLLMLPGWFIFSRREIAQVQV